MPEASKTPTPTLTPTSGVTATVWGVVWLDSNRDGMRDVGEPGIPGVELTLETAAARGVDALAQSWQTTTNAQGRYRFDNLAPGTYTLYPSRFPSRYIPTTAWRVILQVEPNMAPKRSFGAATPDRELYLPLMQNPSGSPAGF
ncbi:MAG: hypothetical protein D6791_09555 [Chloroflexi bacterium]|nr:MAG: hypothetical protein D6791_09555 [Chloroflexota bacterium]